MNKTPLDTAFNILMREYDEWPKGQMGELGQGVRLGLSLGLRMLDMLRLDDSDILERDYKEWVDKVARRACEARGRKERAIYGSQANR